MTWRDVFDTTKKSYGSIEWGAQAAVQAGYVFFCWNDRIYNVTNPSSGLIITDTKLLVKNIK